jgi:hypothetical protein
MIYKWHVIDLEKETSFIISTDVFGRILGSPEKSVHDEFINYPDRYEVMLLKRGEFNGKKTQERKIHIR